MRAILLCVAISVAALTACTTSESSAPAPSTPHPTSASSSGRIVVPDLLGLDLANARPTLRQVGLSMKVSVVMGVYTRSAVVGQRPAAGSTVQPGATIHIILGPASDE